VSFQAISSPTEHYLVTSNPAELADYAENGAVTDSGSGSGSGSGQAYVDLGPAIEDHTRIEGDEFGSETPDTAHLDLEP
jgi:hypothetical protein